jgi:hypothetical protein
MTGTYVAGYRLPTPESVWWDIYSAQRTADMSETTSALIADHELPARREEILAALLETVRLWRNYTEKPKGETR